MSKPTLNPVLRDFWFTPARNRILYGGRASSKSWDAAGISIMMTQAVKLRIMAVRQFQNKIEDSVYSLLKIQIERFNLKHDFTVLNNKIINNTTGSEFLFYGIQRNLDEIKSTEDVDILWVEEAHGLTKEQWEILEPTIRKKGSQCWFVFNPRYVSDYIWQRFVVKPPPNTMVRRINYDENPFLSDTMQKIIKNAKEEDIKEYDHIYGGHPKTDSEKTIIPRSWVEAAVNRDLGSVHTTQKMAGLDVGDGEEGDGNCITIRRGSYVEFIEEFKETNTTQAARRSLLYCKTHKCREMAFDSIGVGAGVKGESRELEAKHDWKTYPVNVAVAPTDAVYSSGLPAKELFGNLKMELWWKVRERFEKTYKHFNNIKSYPADEMISIPDNEGLIFELSTMTWIDNSNGKMLVEPKKKYKERLGVHSPNLADSLILSFARNPSKNIRMIMKTSQGFGI